jgi:hypothetical protein
MEIGVYHEFHCRPDQTPAEAFEEALAQIEAADRCGLDAIWLAEIHQQPRRSVLTAPLAVASAIAARTRRIKIGTGVQVLPLCHPLRLAEETATIVRSARADSLRGRAERQTRDRMWPRACLTRKAASAFWRRSRSSSGPGRNRPSPTRARTRSCTSRRSITHWPISRRTGCALHLCWGNHEGAASLRGPAARHHSDRVSGEAQRPFPRGGQPAPCA